MNNFLDCSACLKPAVAWIRSWCPLSSSNRSTASYDPINSPSKISGTLRKDLEKAGLLHGDETFFDEFEAEIPADLLSEQQIKTLVRQCQNLPRL